PAAIVADVSFFQPDLFIHGIVIAPTVAVLPDPEPDIIPNIADAIVSTYAAPPGKRPTNEFKILINLLIRTVFSIIYDINTNYIAANNTLCVAPKTKPSHKK